MQLIPLRSMMGHGCFVYLFQRDFECDLMPFRILCSFNLNFATLMTLCVIWKCVEFLSSANTLTKEQGEGRKRVFSMSKELFWMAIGRISVKIEPIGLPLCRWHDCSGRLTSQSKQWAERQWGVSAALEGFNGFIIIQFPTAYGFVFGFVVIESFSCSQDTFHFLIHTLRDFCSTDIMICEYMYLIYSKGDGQDKINNKNKAYHNNIFQDIPIWG